MRRLGPWLLVALLVCWSVPTAPSVAAASGCKADLGKRTPVVLVHGFMSSPDAWGKGSEQWEVTKALSSVPNTYIERFDYAKQHFDWVDNSNIGPRLAERVRCLAASSSAGGGIGKTVVVGHSMGGLAARYAASVGSTTNDLGLVITLGTPNIGSGFANISNGLLQLMCSDYDCTSNTAWEGLRNKSEQIDKLPNFPSQIPVMAIAGDATLKLKIFRVEVSKDTDSDLIVSKKSALRNMAHNDQGGGEATVACTLPFNTNSSSCLHTRLTDNYQVGEIANKSLNTYIASQTKPPLIKTPVTPKPATGGTSNGGGSTGYDDGGLMICDRTYALPALSGSPAASFTGTWNFIRRPSIITGEYTTAVTIPASGRGTVHDLPRGGYNGTTNNLAFYTAPASIVKAYAKCNSYVSGKPAMMDGNFELYVLADTGFMGKASAHMLGIVESYCRDDAAANWKRYCLGQ